MGAKGSTLKRVRQSQKHNLRNKHYKSMIKTAVNDLKNANSQSDAEPLLRRAVSLIDTVAGKNIIHKNKAANQKSQIMVFYNNLK